MTAPEPESLLRQVYLTRVDEGEAIMTEDETERSYEARLAAALVARPASPEEQTAYQAHARGLADALFDMEQKAVAAATLQAAEAAETREASVQAIEEAIEALNIEGLQTYDVERIARAVVGPRVRALAGGGLDVDGPALTWALRRTVESLDYDLHKQIECDEETGEDGYPDLAQLLTDAYVYYGTDETEPFDPGTGPQPGYVAGRCGHRVAESEWRVGFRVCERCS